MRNSYAQRQQAESDALPTRSDFPSWPAGPRISNLPLRRMGGRSKVNSDGCHRSYKHPLAEVAMIDGDSDIELDLLMFAEVDPTVTFIVAQPTRIAYAHEDRIRVHLPDFAIIRNGRAEIHEAKSAHALERPKVRSALAAAATHVGNWPDWTYLVTSGQALRASPLRPAVTDLWRHHRRSYDDLQLAATLDVLARGDESAADLASALARLDPAPSVDDLLSMAAGCRVYADLAGGVGPHTPLRFPDPRALPDSILPCLPAEAA